MTYDTRLTVDGAMRDLAHVGASFVPTLMTPTGAIHYRAVIICRPGRTARRLRAFAPPDSEQGGSDRRASTLVMMGSAPWFSPISTADAVAYCVEPIDGGGRPQFKQALKWLRKQGATTILTLEQLDREATRHGLTLTKGKLDS